MSTRCFFAIGLADTLVSRLQDSRESYLAADPTWTGEKWVDPGSLHITLAFMPSVPDSAVGGLLDEARGALSCTAAFLLRACAVQAVPRPARARMLWSAFRSEGEEIADLARLVQDVCYLFLPDDASHRAFEPHVTLCRARRPRQASQQALDAATATLLQGGPPTVSVSEVTLISSVLGQSGPTYSRMGSVLLERD